MSYKFGEAPQPGTFNVKDYGAVTISLGDDQDQAAVAMRTANVNAINAAIAAALAVPNGGTIIFPPGIYLTNNWVGINVAADTNANIIFKGLSAMTFIRSNNPSEATFRLHTSSGNLRGILVQDLVLEGGREGLSLRQVAYSRFERIWFWGAKNDSLHVELGVRNVFHACRFDESAQGIRDGYEADAAVFISSEDTVSHCNFGEYSGGVIIDGGNMLIDNCVGADCTTRRAIWFDYINNILVDQSSNLLPMKAAIIVWQGAATINGFAGKATIRFVSAFRAYEVIINGCRVQTDQDISGFVGFINVVVGGGPEVALNVAGSSFVWLGNRSGYFIADPDSTLTNAMILAQFTVYSGSTMTEISSSAPKLLNPGSENNFVIARTFVR